MKLTVNTQEKGESLGDMFGIFFEDLNHAADGGLYAELIRNRSFEFAPIDNPSYHALTAWEKIETDGEANLVVEIGNPISNQNPHYLGIDVLIPGKNVGVCNTGFNTGIPFKENEGYYFTCYAKREQSLEEPITISFRSKEGDIYSSKDILLTAEWNKYELEFRVPVTDYSGRLAITVSGRGKVYLDFVSLFPKDTYKGRRNGLRKDIAEKLEEMHPKFMRFPGGCLVHNGSLDGAARDSQYRWKNTIGRVEDRPARSSGWLYNQTLGLGYFEFFQFCEDIGAKPLPVLPAGYDPHHHRAAALDGLQPWIDDALDLIEFANGDTSTNWGRKRAEFGHEAPFGMEYLGIGNEEVGSEFFERYEIIYKAVREKHPEIKIIGTSGPNAAGGEYERGWKSARENGTDLVDEHYYQSPEWFLANHHRYDDFKAENPKVFLGEYASWGNTWYNALAEASYMIGLERNAKAVGLACYAPMLCNVDYMNWKPDMIWFNNHQVYGTANYYVQKLFMNHQGDHLLEVAVQEIPDNIVITEDIDRISGEIVLSSNETTVEYYDITVTNDDTGVVGTYSAVKLDQADKEISLLYMDCMNYTLRMKAKEKEGFKGFQIYFGRKDEKNQMWWLIGGWQNQDTYIAEQINGRNSDLSQYLLSVEKEKEYELELKVRGRMIETFVNGEAFHKTMSKPVVIEPLYYSASKDKETGDIILKVINVSDLKRKAEIELRDFNIREDKTRTTIYSMKGYDLEAMNDFEHPEYVSPIESQLQFSGQSFKYEFEEYSITIFRFHKISIKESESSL